ncbi:MAG: serine hydrolase [Thermosynechococcaceae cyanobacterium]
MSQRARKASTLAQQRQMLQRRRQMLKQPRQNRQDPGPALLTSNPRRHSVDQRLQPQGQTLRSVASTPLASPLSRSTSTTTNGLSQLPASPPTASNALCKSPRPASNRNGLYWIGQGLKLVFLGLGVSAMAGTAIAILHPEPHPSTLANSLVQFGKSVDGSGRSVDPKTAANAMRSAGLATVPVLDPAKEITAAKTQIQSLAAAQPDLGLGAFFYNPDTGAYLDLAGDQPFPAASTIKLPVIIAFFQDVDAGLIRLDEQLVMRKDLIASESGAMQYQPPDTKFSALETADNMITVSDNTATNMLIDRLGGSAKLNERFKAWGLTQTVIRNPLPDLQGTNTISPKDLSTLLMKISQGELLTPHSRDRALNILRHTVTNTLLTPGLGEGATIAHKTGDIGSVVGDAGLVEMPNGQRYVATVMVKRPFNDPRAQELIRKISAITYEALHQTASVAFTTLPTPATTP